MNRTTHARRAKLNWLFTALLMCALLALSLLKSDVLTSRAFNSIRPSAGVSAQSEKAPRLFNQQSRIGTSAESETVAISLERVDPCSDCGGDRSFHFAVKNKLDNASKTFTIQNETAQIDSILIADASHAVVLGSVNGTLRSVNIVNTDTGAVTDYFYCYFPALSPDGRFLAYVRAVPRFAASEDQNHVYLVYDLTASAAQNRLLQNGSPDEPSTDRLENRTSVGTPVYAGNRLRGDTHDTSVADGSRAHVLASDSLFWVKQDVLMFVDRWKKINRLIVINLNDGIAQAKVNALPLDTDKIVDSKACKESPGAPENLIQVTDISPLKAKKGFVRLTFELRGRCLLNSTLDMYY